MKKTKNKSKVISLKKEKRKRERNPGRYQKLFIVLVMLLIFLLYFSKDIENLSFGGDYLMTVQNSIFLDKDAPHGRSLGIIPQGAVIKPIDEKEHYYEIEYKDIYGYIPKNFVIRISENSSGGSAYYNGSSVASWTKENDEIINHTAINQSGPDKTVYRTTGEANFREMPFMNGTLISSLPKSAEVFHFESGNEWSRVFYGGRVGYIHKSLLKK